MELHYTKFSKSMHECKLKDDELLRKSIHINELQETLRKKEEATAMNHCLPVDDLDMPSLNQSIISPHKFVKPPLARNQNASNILLRDAT